MLFGVWKSIEAIEYRGVSRKNSLGLKERNAAAGSWPSSNKGVTQAADSSASCSSSRMKSTASSSSAYPVLRGLLVGIEAPLGFLQAVGVDSSSSQSVSLCELP